VAVHVIFWWEGSECLGATEHDLYKNIGDVDVCIEFEMLEVKVPIISLGTVAFSLPRGSLLYPLISVGTSSVNSTCNKEVYFALSRTIF
jgi:hypothetical protein